MADVKYLAIAPANKSSPPKETAIHTGEQLSVFGNIPLLGFQQQHREGEEKGLLLLLKSFMNKGTTWYITISILKD